MEKPQESNEPISTLNNEIKLLKENYKRLESEILVSKTVSSLLPDQINNVEKQCWANAQYSRRECLEVVVIKSSVNINDLGGKVCSVFNRSGVAIKPDDIGKQKLGKQVLQVKKELKNADSIEFDFC